MIYKSRFRMLVESQLELIENGEWERSLSFDAPASDNSMHVLSSFDGFSKQSDRESEISVTKPLKDESDLSSYISDETQEIPFDPLLSRDQVSDLREKVAATLDKQS